MESFKQTKDVKETPAAEAQTDISASPTAPARASDMEPVAGVSLQLYAEISKGLAAVYYQQAQAPALALAKGVQPQDWEVAMTEWTARMRRDPTIAKAFNTYYTEA